MNISDITAVFVNCCTFEYTKALVDGLRNCYPDLKFVIVDNGSFDESTEYLNRIDGMEGLRVIFNETNRGHGPGMDQAIRGAKTSLLLVLDSDVEVLQCGFLELMVPYFEADPQLYLLGDKSKKGRCGRARQRYEQALRDGTLNVNLFHSMMRRDWYLTLPRFPHHGSISTMNQNEGRERGLAFGEFPIQKYLHHIGGRTITVLGGRFVSGEPIDPRTFRGEEY